MAWNPESKTALDSLTWFEFKVDGTNKATRFSVSTYLSRCGHLDTALTETSKESLSEI